ncbi:signal transduction histidine kinase [Dysgonomonas sp. PFB1-18]|uniref:sensor histidine kinase n=1 Tax=unclassified Dysgonomonas TaxID=2630389 RepID=UPI002474144E|nr:MULTISPECIES: HAMP domain-containing sensor histidine kinase [unclassified Dysgonomonas]MDH6311127.1 signal transduction histidine kinase [Dysgonomonas sp. PF1-14]MDH6341019.1 signal transduction histidine kinase [Dysgonomonas sp. PF1-16]MDH6382659.1 signal transduction histidine kinase [Dysgonomonas sp. PFB1-18]MDH6399992.1 signal transduction histidine kinase [Dysgonomonas sp. PF1-23]
MSLIKLIRRYLFISILVVLLVGCISHFLIFRFFIHYSSDQMLKDQKARIENYIIKNDTLPLAPTLVLKPARIEETAIESFQMLPKEVFRDTVMYSEETGIFTPYRQLYFTVSYKDKYHLITLNQPTIISNDLFYAIVSSLLILLILFVLFTYVVEYLLKRNVWKPLNYNLQKLHEYDLKANTVLELNNPGIAEFDEINDVIMRMVDKINADYENSRLFTEDASHEMQTPLSIIKSKMDLLMQNPTLMQDAENERSIEAISRAVSRLSRLNKSLLLITKINNDQYEQKDDVRLDKKLRLYLSDLEELFEAKNLAVKTNVESCNLYINSSLTEILLSNLLSNAVRHNRAEGWIDIYLDKYNLIISNTCKIGQETSNNLFNRITFHNKVEDSLGLGLNIVKSICDKNGYTIEYDYPEEDIFRITIIFH